MMKLSRLLANGAACGLALLAGGAHGQMLSYSDGVQTIEGAPASILTAASNGSATVVVAAGVERRVRVIVRNGTVELSNTTSSLLKNSDRVSVGGFSYIGASLSVQLPATDGTYAIETRVEAANGALVRSDSYSLEVDRTPPTSGCFSFESQQSSANIAPCAPASKWMISPQGSRYIILDNVQDKSSVTASFEIVTSATGAIKTSGSAIFNRDTKTVSIGDGTIWQNSTSSNYFKDGEGYYIVRVKMIDAAGNSSHNEQQVYYYEAGPAPILVGVYDASYSGNFLPGSPFSGYRPYVSGMTVNDYHLKLVYKVPRNFMDGSNPAGFILVDSGTRTTSVPDYVDQNYAYIIVDHLFQYGGSFSSAVQLQRPNYPNAQYFKYSLSLSPLVSPAPRMLSQDYYFADSEWSIPEKERQRAASLEDSNALRYWNAESGYKSILMMKGTVEARSYDQVIVTPQFGVICSVPAGQTSCIGNVNWTQTTAYGWLHNWQTYAAKSNERDYKSQELGGGNIAWDTISPVITSHSFNSKEEIVTLGATKSNGGEYYNMMRFAKPWLMVTKISDGSTVRIEPDSWNTITKTNADAIFSYKSLEDGAYNVTAYWPDSFDNTGTRSLGTLTIDKSPPKIMVQVKGVDIGDDATISSLDDVRIGVSDADGTTDLSWLRIAGGPAGENVGLSWRRGADGLLAPESLVLFPSSAPSDYQLVLSAVDKSGNRLDRTVALTYQPATVGLSNGRTSVRIPAIDRAFRTGGRYGVTTNALTVGGSPLSGTYAVRGSLRTDAKASVTLGGVTLKPGDRNVLISAGYDFGKTGGVLELPVAGAGQPGTSNVLLTIDAPNAPYIAADIVAWLPDMQLSSPSWAVRQALDTINITASVQGCKLTADPQAAAVADPLADPVCLLEWTARPDESHVAANGINLGGEAVAVGVQAVSWRASLFDGATKVTIGELSKSLTVTSAIGAVTLGFDKNLSVLTRKIGAVEALVRRTDGLACPLTFNEADAKVAPVNARKCLFEWGSLPDGLAQHSSRSEPTLAGVPQTAGPSGIRMKAYVWSRLGTKVQVADQTLPVEVVNPSAPTITAEGKTVTADNRAMAYPTGGKITDVVIASVNAQLGVEIKRGDLPLENQVYAASLADSTRTIKRTVTAPQSALGEIITYTVRAWYVDVPEVETTWTLTVTTVPGQGVRPSVSVPKPVWLDTETAPVSVRITDLYARDTAYSRETMGAWQVRLVNLYSSDNMPALSDWVDVDAAGTASINLDMATIGQTSFKLAAQARLLTTLEGVSRQEVSQAVYTRLIKGSPITGTLAVRRESGRVPFAAVAYIRLDRASDRGALGDVQWRWRPVGAADWTDGAASRANVLEWSQAFSAGQYEIQAVVSNKNSGATFATNTVTVTAFEVLDVEVDGPQNVFVGTTGQWRTVSREGEALTGVVTEWSTDGGETWSVASDSFSLAAAAEQRLQVWSRTRTAGAPASDPTAWKMVKRSVSFVSVRPVKARASGPFRLESNTDGTFTGRVELPYPRMSDTVIGQWTLPDGSTVDGMELTWRPTEQDGGDTGVAVLRFRGRVAGVPGTEAETEWRVKVWDYEWPTFGVEARSSTKYAPATVDLRLTSSVNIQRLEQRVIAWSLPETATVVEETETRRKLRISVPGVHTVSVRITDARGNEAVVPVPVSLEPPPEWKMELEVRGENRFMRAPLDVTIKPLHSGGHPDERVQTVRYFVDDVEIEPRATMARATLGAGERRVRVVASSTFGQTWEASTTVQVVANQPPTCTVTREDRSYAWTFRANCTDPDGRLKTWLWTIDGEEREASYQLSIPTTGRASPPVVTLVGVDDGGARSAAAQP